MQLSNTTATERETTALLRKLATTLLAQEAAKRERTFHLAEVGQRVYLTADVAKQYGVKQGPYEITDTKGIGGDQFVALKGLHNLSGEPRFVRTTQLTAAPATKIPSMPPMFREESQMQMNQTAANAELLQLAERLRREQNLSWDDAARAAGKLRPDLVDAGRPVEPGATVLKTPISPAFNLSAALEAKAENGATFLELCQEYADEKRCDLRDAIHVLGQRFPELATAR